MSRGKTEHESVNVNGPSLGYIFAAETAKHIVVVRSFFLWPVMAIAAFMLHHFWPDNMYVLAFLSMITILFALYVWMLTHTRHVLGYAHAILTVLIVGGMFTYMDAVGWNKVSVFMMIVLIPFLCLSWSIRTVVREGDTLDSRGLASMFETAGMPGTKMRIHPPEGDPRARKTFGFNRKKAEVVETAPTIGRTRRAKVDNRIRGTVHMTPGDTADTLIKSVRKVESAAGVPPGTITATPNIDHAGRADVVISDPRLIRRPVDWPGPSWLKGSIADPLSVGMYQDGTECEFILPETQIQIMGMVGSGKSLGAGWSTLAEVVTREDVVVWAVDITKGMQTLGALAPALHRIATTPEEAMQLLADANSLIKPRTNYLAKKGLGKWKKGCGLNYLVVWIEEVPDVVEALGEDGEALWIKSVKAARSAGITFVWSLQRADYSQIPTITRGQAIKWCFGVADSHEASFGLSEVQNAGDCSPELWGQRQPGMSYLDAPSIPEDRVCMALRTWYWGKDDSKLKEHAAKFPASERPYDAVMELMLDEVEPITIEPPQSEEDIPDDEETEDSDVITDEELDQELEQITDDQDFVINADKPDQLDPVDARAKVREWLVERAGQRISNADLTEVRKSTGYGRTWGYKILGEFETLGLVTREDRPDGIHWVVTTKREILSRDD